MRALRKTVQICTWLAYVSVIALLLTYAPLIVGYQPLIDWKDSNSLKHWYNSRGSIIYYKNVERFEDCHVGDTIVINHYFGEPTELYVIEEVKDDKQCYTIQTEKKELEDISYMMVRGKACTCVIPFLGYLALFMKRLPVIIFIIITLLADLILNADPPCL